MTKSLRYCPFSLPCVLDLSKVDICDIFENVSGANSVLVAETLMVLGLGLLEFFCS